MIKTNLSVAFELLHQHKLWDSCGFFGEVSSSIISVAEKILELKFPNSYRLFIEQVGSGGPGSAFIPGVLTNDVAKLKEGGIVWGVLKRRTSLQFPYHLIRLYDVGEGTTYCLDTSQMNGEGECPVVAWPVGGYEETPVLEIVAPDFGTFFLDLVKRELHLETPSDGNGE